MLVAFHTCALLILTVFAWPFVRDEHAHVREFVCVGDIALSLVAARAPAGVCFIRVLPLLLSLLCVPPMDQIMSLLLIVVVALLLLFHQYLLLHMLVHQPLPCLGAVDQNPGPCVAPLLLELLFRVCWCASLSHVSCSCSELLYLPWP